MSEPNFFVVGAAKSGTTALYHALRQHPDVFLPAVKEPHLYAYLADPSTGSHLYPDQATARRRYRDLYADVAGERAIGDASTTSLVVKGAAAAIAEDAPSARIVVILRQPVDRAFSHWCHFRAAGGEHITDFGTAVSREAERRAAGFPFTYQYLDWGRYSEHLAPFYQRFGRDGVLVHLYDDLRDGPETVVRRTFRFLGVDSSAAVPPLGRYNEIPVPRFPGLVGALRGQGVVGPAVARTVPSRIRRPVAGWVSGRFRIRPTLSPDLRAALTAAFGDEISRLEELIHRDLSAWR